MKTTLNRAGASLLLILTLPPVMAASVADDMIASYLGQGATAPDAARGKALWMERHGERSCTSCHGSNLSLPGKHARTGKLIQPMAPSANPERYTRARKIEKWFLRNCKWTLGRECTVQEKADMLTFLKQL